MNSWFLEGGEEGEGEGQRARVEGQEFGGRELQGQILVCIAMSREGYGT